jgi:hypothetical protein
MGRTVRCIGAPVVNIRQKSSQEPANRWPPVWEKKINFGPVAQISNNQILTCCPTFCTRGPTISKMTNLQIEKNQMKNKLFEHSQMLKYLAFWK